MSDVNLRRALTTGPGILSGFQGFQWDKLVEVLPMGIDICDADGRLIQYNEHASQLGGHAPAPGDGDYQFGGALKAYRLDGELLSRSEGPMAEVFLTGEAGRGGGFSVWGPGGT